MSTFDPHESNKFAQAANVLGQEFLEVRGKVLAEGAALGLPMVDGEGLSALLQAGLKARQKLTAENSDKIYAEEQGRWLQLVEFNLKIAVDIARLAMQLYRENLLNAVAIEQEQELTHKVYQEADLVRLGAAIELRQVAMIMAKADAQHEVNLYELELIAAERGNLPLEATLINAKLQTAIARLAIIAAIYQVVAAEQLVVIAEQQRAAYLQIVVQLEQQLVAIKLAMIPLIEAKAQDEYQLGIATQQDAVVQTEIAQLGFLKNDLTSYDEASQHTLREAELTLEFFTEQLTTATSALDLIRAQNQRLLKEHQNEVRAEVLALKVGLDEMKIDLSLLTHLTRKQIEENAQIALSKNETADVGAILATELQNIKEITTESDGTVATVKAGAKTIASTTVSSTADKWIGKLSGP